MSDDWDRSHWFRDDDDWFEDLIRIIRDLVTNPVPVSFAQLEQFAEQLAKGIRGKSRQIALRELEATARSFDLGNLPAASLFSLAGIVENACKNSQSNLLADVPIAQLSAILRPKLGRLRAGEIVGIVKLAGAQKGKQDVFEDLDLDTASDYVSAAGLKSLTLAELRSTLEGLAVAGVLKG